MTRNIAPYIVLRSVIVLTTDPAPAISTTFSCQLNSTLIACPPPSPPPRECICENPVVCGDMDERGVELVWLAGAGECDMPLYLREGRGSGTGSARLWGRL